MIVFLVIWKAVQPIMIQKDLLCCEHKLMLVVIMRYFYFFIIIMEKSGRPTSTEKIGFGVSYLHKHTLQVSSLHPNWRLDLGKRIMFFPCWRCLRWRGKRSFRTCLDVFGELTSFGHFRCQILEIKRCRNCVLISRCLLAWVCCVHNFFGGLNELNFRDEGSILVLLSHKDETRDFHPFEKWWKKSFMVQMLLRSCLECQMLII